MKQSFVFDRYLRFAELTDVLSQWAAAHPELMRLESMGKSHEGRDLWLVTVTRLATGDAHEKPAFWLDGNIHATEVAGSMACLHFISFLLTHDGQRDDVTRCLDTRAYYICPRLNPDGAEWALADVPRLIRSSTRPYPFDEDIPGGLRREDVDGDGRVLSMRLRDSNGPWKISDEDPRLMVRRDPTETGGAYYRLLPEGHVEDYDGALLKLKPRKQNLDLNRNYPSQWRAEHEQFGAGPYPGSEPEVRAAVDFISRHRNITGGVAFHTYSGVLLRPFSHQADEQFPIEDLWTYQKIGAKGTELTGYPNISVYHDFRYHPKDVITGAFDDWLYEHFGAFAWTVEIWSPQREAGITDYKFIDWYREHPREDDLKLLRWNDEMLGGKGYVNWYSFKHPQLGDIELGGWDTLFSWSNPPPYLLEKELRRFPEWLLWMGLISPRLEVRDFSMERLDAHHHHLRMVVENTGWLPTYVTKKASQNKQSRGGICEINLPEGCELIQGEKRKEIGELEGRAYKPAAPSSWAGWGGDVTTDRAEVEWIVRAPAGARLVVTVRHDRAGTLRREIQT